MSSQQTPRLWTFSAQWMPSGLATVCKDRRVKSSLLPLPSKPTAPRPCAVGCPRRISNGSDWGLRRRRKMKRGHSTSVHMWRPGIAGLAPLLSLTRTTPLRRGQPPLCRLRTWAFRCRDSRNTAPSLTLTVPSSGGIMSTPSTLKPKP